MDESPNVPLIPRPEDQDEHHDGEDAPASTGHLHDGNVGAFLWLLVLSAGISGLLFGCKFSDAVLNFTYYYDVY
jgi:hypothetical protein